MKLSNRGSPPTRITWKADELPDCWAHPRISDLTIQSWGLRTCISNKLPGDRDAADPGTTQSHCPTTQLQDLQSPSCSLLSLLLTSTLGWGELPPRHGRGKLRSAQSNAVTFLRLHSCSAAGTCPPKAPWAHKRFLTRAPWGCDSCLSSSQTVSIYKHGLRPALKNQAGARIPASLSEQQASRSGGQDTGFRVRDPDTNPDSPSLDLATTWAPASRQAAVKWCQG